MQFTYGWLHSNPAHSLCQAHSSPLSSSMQDGNQQAFGTLLQLPGAPARQYAGGGPQAQLEIATAAAMAHSQQEGRDMLLQV